MLTNCFRFAPRDSVPGLISKICKYLKEHPGWSVEELKEVIGDIETSLALGEISYFTNQSINDLDTLALYDTGYRFVFIGGGDVYSAMYALEESDGGVIANGVSLGVTESEFNQLKSIVIALNNAAYTATNPPPYPVTKVNNRTGDVKLDLADVLGESTAQTMLMSEINFASTRLATWNAFYDYGYRVVGVLANDGSSITALYILGQNTGNHAPIPMALSSGGNVISVNGDIGEVYTLRVDPSDPGIPTEPPTPINADTLNGKAPGYYLQPRNLLDNSDFSVAQAGYGGFHGNTKYAADRWFCVKDAMTTFAAADGGGLKITKTGTNSWGAWLRQNVIVQNALKGKTVTLGVKAKSSEGSLWMAIKTLDVKGNEIKSVSKTFSCSEKTIHTLSLIVADNANQIQVSFDHSNAGPSVIEIEWAALYEGEYTADNLPPYVAPAPVLELAKCKNFYKFVNATVKPVFGDGTTTRTYAVEYGEMRVNLNASSIEIISAYERIGWNDTGAAFSVASVYPNNNTALIYATGTVAAGSQCWLMIKIACNADL